MSAHELPSAEQISALMQNAIPIAGTMGVEAVEVAPGYAKTRVPFEGNGNHLGTMYAGVLFTVAEILGGALAAVTFDMSRYAPVVKSVEIDFKRPARSDVTAEARLDEEAINRATEQADAEGRGRYELRATVTDAEGEVVATTVGHYQVRPHGR